MIIRTNKDIYFNTVPQGIRDNNHGGLKTDIQFQVTSGRRLKWQPSCVYHLLMDHTSTVMNIHEYHRKHYWSYLSAEVWQLCLLVKLCTVAIFHIFPCLHALGSGHKPKIIHFWDGWNRILYTMVGILFLTVLKYWRQTDIFLHFDSRFPSRFNSSICSRVSEWVGFNVPLNTL